MHSISSPSVTEPERRSRRVLGLSAWEAAILFVLGVWAFAPLVLALIFVWRHGGVLTGVNGGDFFDQFQYLAWIRDSGSHLLASNLWVIGSTPHDYLQPMYLISGLLWRIGAGLQLAYLVWKPVALLVLFGGFAAYVRHLLPGRRAQQAAALALGLFYQTPVLALAGWTGRISSAHRLALVEASNDANNALDLWGFDHTAIAVGLMPVFLIAAHGLLTGRRSGRRTTAVASVAGLLISWLYPWAAATVLLALAGLFVVMPERRRYRALAVPLAATLAPLVYGFVLTRVDASWHAFETKSELTGTAPWWALLASFGPLVALAALGLRRPRDEREWLLVLWVAAGAAVYFLIPFPPHALSGVTLPLAILAVRGFRRAASWRGAGRRVAVSAGVLALAAFTVPAAINQAQSVSGYFDHTPGGGVAQALLRLTPAQSDALAYLDRSRRPGGVLAPWLLSLSVPAFTDRSVYAGHMLWQPAANLAATTRFFDPALRDPTGAVRRAILARSQATFVLADCGAPPSLAHDLAPVARPVARFGCLTVYATAQPSRR